MTTDTSEKGLESLIVRAMTGRINILSPPDIATETSTPIASGTGWIVGDPKRYDRGACVDLAQLRGFLLATQPKLDVALSLDSDTPTRRQFLARLEKEIGKRGVVDVLRKGIDHGAHHIELFYGTPSPGNRKAEQRFACNRFSVTRQLAYSRDETRRALDLALFVNGLPVATFELKNSLTKQTVADAVQQYCRDRDPREPLFAFGRCVAHFAVDDAEVRFCTELKGKESWFLPFNQGTNGGAGNPPNPDGLKTAYLWERVLTPAGLTDILENYAQIVEVPDRRTGKKKRKQIFPRFHQIDVVRKLLADVREHGVGRRYLVQHSAGSGKSNSIAWLAHQLIAVKRGDEDAFDSIIVVTDRRILDEQIQQNIKQFAQVSAVVGAVTGAGGSKTQQLSKFLASGKKIIITTVQTFPFLLKELDDAHRGGRFAIIIDEAHSSQGGKASTAMNEALADVADDPEDVVNDELQRRMDARKLLTNASYFAFTATPKNKTLEMFGEALPPDAEGKIRHRPFHSYTMKQAVAEGFILDVLASYTPVNSYYKLVKTTEGDPEFDVKKARKKLRRYVEGDDTAIRLKAEIMADHFHEQVIALRKIKGQARAMVVTSGIERAVQYFRAFQAYLPERKSPYRAIVAFSGEHDFGDGKVTETALNGFPSSEIVDRFQEDPYRFLICADKFQTGYDEPLLHTMYVDKPLSGIKAVQTLSRLNRAHPDKHDVFVLDFQNDAETITKAFADYYRTTVLSEETDPNKLHDLKAALDGWQVYAPEQVEEVVTLFLSGAERDKLDPILDACVAAYLERLDEDGQVDFKGKAKAFVRTYEFLASVLPYSNAAWEKLSILLNFLIPKLPAPKEEDLSRGILESIDMDSYRVEKRAAQKLALPDEEGVVGPVPVAGGGHRPEPQMDRLSNILKSFNEQFGSHFGDADRIFQRLVDDVAPKVAADAAYQNAKRNTPETALIELDKALSRVMLGLLKDETEVYKQFVQNPSFKRFVTDLVYRLASERSDDTPPKSPRPRGAGGAHRQLAERLASSADACDWLGAELLAVLEQEGRIRLADTLRTAVARGLTEADGVAAVERLARPQSAGLRRFYVDRSRSQPRLVPPDEVRRLFLAFSEDRAARAAWASQIEVIWAATEHDALREGGAA
ncbi:type I restriction endonuclease subunit R [Sorangium sp. So ce1078]|uniref:type I restriction endonuclease subunit R n=1 Tax=Sorangium sp. So ce1078 TaxID=3133329 RepID=UPI003F62A262